MRLLRDRAAFKRSVNRQVIIGLIPLSLAITLATFFVISNVVSNLAAGIVAGIVGLAIALLWWIIPLRNRRVGTICGLAPGGRSRPAICKHHRLPTPDEVIVVLGLAVVLRAVGGGHVFQYCTITIQPSPWGAKGAPHQTGGNDGRRERRHKATGKVNGVIYDRLAT